MKKNFSYVINELFKNGYCIVENYLSSGKCEKTIKEIEKINNSKINKKPSYKKSLKRGQIAIRDIVPHSIIEKKRVLRNHTDLCTQGCHCYLAKIQAINGDAA